jgi:hypothetical protein
MLKHLAKRVLLSAFCLLLLVSCASPTIATNSPILSTEIILPSATSVVSAPTDASIPTETPTPFPTLTPELERAQYVIDLQLDYTAKAAVVNQTITYPNWSGETLTNLVLAVEPNLWSGGFSLKSITIDDQPVTGYTLENMSQRLEITLPQPLEPSRTVIIKMDYGLILPQMQAYIEASNDIRPQIYGYTARQVNFVDWYPFVVPYQPGTGWILHNPWFYGEHLVYDLADFNVSVTFTDGAAPQIAASGVEVAPSATDATPQGAVSRQFLLEAGRTFALSISDFFKVATQQVGDVTVYSYYFAYYDAPGQAMMQTTVESMPVYT